jgi:hypothetical protein
MMQFIKSTLINGLFLVCLIYGFVDGLEGARNVALFWGWFSGTILTLVIFREETQEALIARKYIFGWPAWLNLAFDLFCGLFFAWFGYFFLAFFIVLHAVVGYHVQVTVTSKIKEAANSRETYDDI